VSPAQRVDYDTERTVFFSDAVIAIAMTLLALELPVPRGDTDAQVWDAFVTHLDDEYLSFVISFAVIATLWFGHHRLFRQVARLDRALAWLNMACLFAIVLIPFVSRLVAVEGDLAFGPICYATVILLYGTAFMLMVLRAKHGSLWRTDAPARYATNALWGMGTVVAVFAASIPVALVAASAAEYIWLSIPLVSAITNRHAGGRPPLGGAPAE